MMVVELWDKDESGGDDFIGSYILDMSDDADIEACLQYSWDGAARGETYPDTFVRTDFRVQEPGASFYSQGCMIDSSPGDSCGEKIGETWRDFAVTDCNGSCTSATTLVYSSSATGFFNRSAMVMHSMAQAENVFGQDASRATNMWVFMDGDICGAACSYAKRWISMPFTSVRRWGTPTHEAGHPLQKQAMNVDSLPGLACPDPHVIDEQSNEACATREGFAHYIHAVSWWSPANSSSRPVKSGESIEGYEISSVYSVPHNSSSADNSEIEIEVAKTFWDLDDVRNEGGAISPGSGADQTNVSTTSILDVWHDFPNGTANHQDQEDLPSFTEAAGNLEDYRFNTTIDIDSSMDHNATDCQSTT